MADLKVSSDLIRDINLVIFDKDGTLIDLYRYWSSMVGFRVDMARARLKFSAKQKKDIMYAMGVDLENKRLRSDGPVGLKKRSIVMQAMIDSLAEIGFPGTYDLCCDIFKKADEMSLSHFPEIIKPIDGMHQLINSLCGKKCRIAVATTDKTERAALAVEFLMIADRIDIVVGEDMVKNYKPHPDMIDLILNKLSMDRQDAVMVGDAITDVEMGINAGLKASIAVCSGLTPREKFEDKTRYIVKDISRIKVI